ncbi:MAG: S1-like domain-containing RNA-binding protein [Halioglobus sp.]
MLQIGQFNTLSVIDTRANGVVLDGGESRQVFMPVKEDQASYRVGEEVIVFIYLDSEGRFAATTEQPLAELGKVAWLEVADVNQTGAFVDWGLPKDLFIPFAEQQHDLRKGQKTLVKVYLDNQNRLAGTTRIDHWIKDDASALQVGEKVSLIIADRTELGFKAIINHTSWGLLFSNELFQPVRKGQVIDGYVKQIRADNKVDLTLAKPGFSKGKIDPVAQRIIQELQANDGRLLLTDKSPPAEIYAVFGVSKKVFKQAIGALYKQRRISLDGDSISLIE